MNRTGAPENSVRCRECRYYLVTWDVSFPHGCRAHTFKSKKIPAMEVYEASGLQCLLFAPKKSRAVVEAAEPAMDRVTI
jgi:hypothetical protein